VRFASNAIVSMYEILFSIALLKMSYLQCVKAKVKKFFPINGYAGLCRFLAIHDNQMGEGKYASKTIGTWPYNLA
jgi:hypothetical protein